ncbi:S-adenosyl-L-methionine-dependent methyltransferase [Podospora didyma]|uniref:DNA (cytosine-5-)-methyltransferase n=1 Tax=Podospora didyma TaxID=330526 RepID=A0AAE0U6U6_9PEZI|nr:S-adenosyl-L-methionine-dependent methyltransferase [Podospora didyma]
MPGLYGWQPRFEVADYDDIEDGSGWASRNQTAIRRKDGEDGRYQSVEDFEDTLIGDIIDLTDTKPIQKAKEFIKREDFSEDLRKFVRADGLVFTSGTCAELSIPIEVLGLKIEFLKIHSIVYIRPQRQTMLRCFVYCRANQFKGRLPRILNEVCAVSQLDDADPRSWKEQSLELIHPDAILRIRDLRTTNTLYPSHRFEPEEFKQLGKEYIKEYGPLVCRYRYVEHSNDMNSKKAKSRNCEWAFMRITEDEADQNYKIKDDAITNQWRGGKVVGGSAIPGRSSIPVFDLESSRRSSREGIALPGQKYSAGDAFAGGGGASRGIVAAGLSLDFAVDHWATASESLRANFQNSGTKVYGQDMHNFITDKSTNCRVDMLHLSPPCQVWSPCHTVAGKNDEMNESALFACSPLVEKIRPRLFTVEQTFGMLHPRFEQFFNAFVQGFTFYGYSVRWKIVYLPIYGLPQPRRRLVMIGAGPGERLPSFPPATHCQDPSSDQLEKFVSVRTALAPTKHLRDPLHDKRRFKKPKAAWNADGLLRATMTTDGGGNYHYRGRRDFTLREYATLQGFPINHIFRGTRTDVKKQIGNAFPSSVVEVLYKHLAQCLDRRDGSTTARPMKGQRQRL